MKYHYIKLSIPIIMIKTHDGHENYFRDDENEKFFCDYCCVTNKPRPSQPFHSVSHRI